MIKLHRFGHQAEEFHLNQELIVTVEANPDTVITLTNGTKIVVVESPDRVAERVTGARAEVLIEAARRRRERRERELRAERKRTGEPALAVVPPAAGA